jgi:hypothetical protein
MKRLTILLVLALQATAGCSALNRADPVVTRRYAARQFVREDTPRVRITVFAVPVPAPASSETVLTSLAPEAQAELVQLMGSRTENQGARSLVQALALPIRGESSAPSFRDLTRMSRRLVFSLDNQSPEPSARVSQARIFVQPLGDTRFVSWNRIENVYETVELGKLSLSQGRSTSAELGLTLPVLSAAPKVSASAESTLGEEVLLTQRRTALTGALTPTHAMLLQQGGAGIDLTGNVTADFEIAVPHGGDHTVFIPVLPMSGGAPACGTQPSFNRQTIRYPASGGGAAPDSVRVDVTLEYTLRDVRQGHETITESDDFVVFATGVSRAQGVAIIPAEALRFSVFELRMGDGRQQQRPTSGAAVTIQGASGGGSQGRISPLEFATFEEGVAMLTWLRKCNTAAVGFPLLLDGRPLMDNELPRLFVWRRAVNHPAEN